MQYSVSCIDKHNKHKSMTKILICMAVGIAAGVLIRNINSAKKAVEKLIDLSICVLLFFMGLSIGFNDEIISNISNIGIDALLLTIGGILGSSAFSYLVYKSFYKKKKN